MDDRRIVSAIVSVIRNGLRWRDAPPEYGPHKTIYNRFIRWSTSIMIRSGLQPLPASSAKILLNTPKRRI